MNLYRIRMFLIQTQVFGKEIQYTCITDVLKNTAFFYDCEKNEMPFHIIFHWP